MRNYGSIITGKAKIGKGTKIGHYGYIAGKIGKDCNIQNGVYIYEGATVGDNVFIGPRVMLLNDKYPPSYGKAWKKIKIKDGASIGAGSIIMAGVTIGKKAVIGAGSLITKDVGDKELVYNKIQPIRSGGR